jgi:hypothetical protein
MPWLRHLAVLFALLAAIVRPAPASALTPASPESRVGGFEVAAQLLAGELAAASREQHQGIGAAYDENASGYSFAARGGTRAIDPNRLNHIFGKVEHALDDFVAASGGRDAAFNRIQDAANAALREGRLPVGPNGVLPSGDAGPIISVGGTQIRLIGGRVVDGVVQIGSASRRGLP